MKRLYYIGFLVILLTSCEQDKGKNIPALDDVEVETAVLSFMPADWTTSQLDSVCKAKPVLSEIFFGHILALPLDNKEEMYSGYRSFWELEATQNIGVLVDSVYNDVSEIERSWKNVMAYFQFYFPERKVPYLHLLRSNLGIANFLFEDGQGNEGVGVSLDFFLGESFPYLQLARDNPAFSDYNNRTFNKDHLITKSVNAIIEDVVPTPSQSHMLGHLIREGKRQYLLKAVCNMLPDSAVFELSPKDLTWCENNELEIWNFFIEQELLYETNQKKFFKYIKPAPNSAGMPSDAPGKTGVFIGYKIVEAFVQKYPEFTLRQLVEIEDQMLFDKSNYRPRRR